jgi:uncharacterized alpha/beta hydrolase family protein
MLYEKYNICNTKTKFLVFVCLSVAIVAGLSLAIYHGSANAQNKTLIEPAGIKSATTNATKINIVLVHGQFADASSWSKVIPFLQDAGHKIIAVVR